MRVSLRVILVALVVVTALAMRINTLVSTGAKTITLDEAIKQKIVTAKFTGLGGHSGNCVQMQLTNNKNKDLTIVLPAGTMFEPGDAEAQNILMPQEQLMVLKGGEKKGMKVRGFCCQASDKSPSAEMDFVLSYNDDAKMKQLYNFVKGKKYNDAVLQDAVWALSDDHSVSNVYGPDVRPLREELCKIKGTSDTWYSTPQHHTVDAEGRISHETVQVTGLIKFKAAKAGKIMSEIHDATGKLVTKNPNGLSFPAGNIEYEFNIKVGGWEKGSYTVHLINNGEEIHKQEFKI
ncbi:MAG TPA: hypothetical protein VK177_02130 [Flavobacteriales bacterium]|nr:hypothetical protein [Flavobacteriales bacterium]